MCSLVPFMGKIQKNFFHYISLKSNLVISIFLNRRQTHRWLFWYMLFTLLPVSFVGLYDYICFHSFVQLYDHFYPFVFTIIVRIYKYVMDKSFFVAETVKLHRKGELEALLEEAKSA